MTKTVELHVSVIVPQNILHFCCSYSGATKPGVPYRLNETDPVRFKEVLQTIKTAPSSAYVWENRDEVEDLRDALKKWNIEHPNDQVTEEEIIRSVCEANYHQSKIGTEGKYKDQEMHAFHDIDLWNFTHGGTKYTIYLKFVIPGDGKLNIVSFHRNKALDRAESAEYRWYYTDEGL